MVRAGSGGATRIGRAALFLGVGQFATVLAVGICGYVSYRWDSDSGIGGPAVQHMI